MPKRHSKNPRTAPVRLSAQARDIIDGLARWTGWSATRCLDFFIFGGRDALHGNDTAVRNRRKLFDTAKALRTAEEKAFDKLQPKRAAFRAAQSLMKLSGPDIPDATQIGKELA